MTHKNGWNSGNAAYLAVIAIVAIAAAFVLVRMFQPRPQPPQATSPQAPATIKLPAKPQPVVDYNRLGEDPEVTTVMAKRKSGYGMDDGVDLIVKSDESIRIGSCKVSMQEILEKVRLGKGEVIENDLRGGPLSDADIQNEYGIHVVQRGDNIWNIHFKFMKEYFNHRNIRISELADEPNGNGRSSGIGKILKFSENIVYIYNLKERKLDTDIHLIQPLSKVVIYNMKEIFDLLDPIDLKNANSIRFDGETLWIQAEQENQLNN